MIKILGDDDIRFIYYSIYASFNVLNLLAKFLRISPLILQTKIGNGQASPRRIPEFSTKAWLASRFISCKKKIELLAQFAGPLQQL